VTLQSMAAKMSDTLARNDFELPGGAAVIIAIGGSGSILRPATGSHDDGLNVLFRVSYCVRRWTILTIWSRVARRLTRKL
jgi:hypothetical protein